MKRAAPGLALLASACATTPAPAPSYLFWDSTALDQLVEAAHACGLREVEAGFSSFPERNRHMVPSVEIPVRKTDPAFRCTMAWIAAHPEKGLKVPE